MRVEKNHRHFEMLVHPSYLDRPTDSQRLAQASSAIGPYENSLAHPGTSFLWLGENHHLNRDEVRQLVAHLQAWLATGSLHLAEQKGE